jgi:hypothetical protein
MQQIKKIAVLPNDQIFVTYSDENKYFGYICKEINAKELSQILEENENQIKKWSLIGNIQIINFK